MVATREILKPFGLPDIEMPELLVILRQML